MILLPTSFGPFPFRFVVFEFLTRQVGGLLAKTVFLVLSRQFGTFTATAHAHGLFFRSVVTYRPVPEAPLGVLNRLRAS